MIGLIVSYILIAIGFAIYARNFVSFRFSEGFRTATAAVVGALWLFIVPCVLLIFGLEEFNEWRDYRRYIRDHKKNGG